MDDKKKYPPLEELRREFGFNKEIPSQYELPILRALSHFPELKEIHINFELKRKQAVPYGTYPAPRSILRGAKKRKYVIGLLEEAELPERQALFKNLPEEAQVAVIGHELGHVVQYQNKSFPGLLKTAWMFSNVYDRREVERDADLCAIKHGLGFELYVHAVYIRTIPGYVQHRKEIDTDFLKPQEILDTLPAGSISVQ